LQDPPKITQIWNFGFKINYLATLFLFFHTKNSSLGIIWRVSNGKFWNLKRPFWIIYCGLVHFMATWFILLEFGIFFPILVCYKRKIWQHCSKLGTFQLKLKNLGYFKYNTCCLEHRIVPNSTSVISIHTTLLGTH
jgi:hypothetical protein